MADWSALPADLVRSVADRLLAAAGDVDYYMGMRAVCHSWRLAIADPCGGAGLHRFRPRHWIMLDDAAEQQPVHDEGGVRLFLNVATGRVLRLRVPLLRDHVLVAASDGLLVLGDKKYPHRASVLNPFTGSLVRFVAAIPRVNRVRAVVTGSEDDRSLSLVFSFYHDPCSDAITCAHPTAARLSPVQLPYYVGAGPFYSLKQENMVAYRGHVYVAYRDGLIVRFVAPSAQHHQHCHAKLIVSAVPSSDYTGRFGRAFLVASGGDLLLVRLYHLRRRRAVEVFRVDVKRKAPLEPVRSIGRHALFLGGRSLSVNAVELPSVDGDCVYLASENRNVAWRYDLRDGSETMISSFDARPFGLVQVLLNYCVVLPDAKAQLHSVYRTECLLSVQSSGSD
ncbi:unnamed protein product [Triticum turgidum subsp. durum]|uniref:KIB1-4 beta-propeller domain-containing protein n=1 Tax=Triticum turgidum subsp. durum TaxID=4567 RepID=A0A9R1S9W7_TRITD|nr:unnamed protein product [Triticum turgidum subsp. durum]